ncbi:alanine--tRNA ligase-related protein [Patescibacteria group bacterium AH-259-L05]|nr:alanine--tRNA ligase-related protein [Patescibacteria group bacterium AH-259-L05]
MKTDKIRKTFLDFFKRRGHEIIPSSSLIPADPTALFTSAGMQQFVPYLSGEVEPPYRRAASAQKCFRTSDIDEVGDEYHHTYFEMLGNWSFGDYFKTEAIQWALELLVKEYKLPQDKLWVTVFLGERGVSKDTEAAKLWEQFGVDKKRIKEFGMEDNFWGPVGSTGPCGPCTEIHYDQGKDFQKEKCSLNGCGPNCSCGRFVEVWNLVFMEYRKTREGKYEKLPAQNVDTGAGLERLAAVLQNKSSDYETDLFLPIVNTIKELSPISLSSPPLSSRATPPLSSRATPPLSSRATPPLSSRATPPLSSRATPPLSSRATPPLSSRATPPLSSRATPPLSSRATPPLSSRATPPLSSRATPPLSSRATPPLSSRATEGSEGSQQNEKAVRVIADHMRAVCFLIADGVIPSNEDRGYMLRRLMRRAMRYARRLHMGKNFLIPICQVIIDVYKGQYPELQKKQNDILTLVQNEEEKFMKSLRDGLKRFRVLVQETKNQDETVLDPQKTFQLYDTYGFPIELTIEMAQEKGLTVDEVGFQKEFERHRKISRAGAVHKFSGVGEWGDKVAPQHSATHLLHQALRDVLGEHVHQDGSDLTPERLRFDFTHPKPLTKEEIKAIEDLVNKQIERDLIVTVEKKKFENAVKAGALAFFREKYPKEVTVYTMGDFSKEVCTGPHVKHTNQIGKFKIVKDEALSAGARRIRAVVEGSTYKPKGISVFDSKSI